MSYRALAPFPSFPDRKYPFTKLESTEGKSVQSLDKDLSYTLSEQQVSPFHTHRGCASRCIWCASRAGRPRWASTARWPSRPGCRWLQAGPISLKASAPHLSGREVTSEVVGDTRAQTLTPKPINPISLCDTDDPKRHMKLRLHWWIFWLWIDAEKVFGSLVCCWLMNKEI